MDIACIYTVSEDVDLSKEMNFGIYANPSNEKIATSFYLDDVMVIPYDGDLPEGLYNTGTDVFGKSVGVCTVNVKTTKFDVTSVTLNKTSLALEIGDIETLTATVAPDNATNKNVTWSSTDENVATVSGGTVTAVGEGTATITVTTEDGAKSAACTVTVTKPEEEEPEIDTKAVFTFADVTGRPGETINIKVSLKTEEKINTIVLSGFEYDKDLLTFDGFYDYDHIKDMSMLPPTFDEDKMAVAIALAQNQAFDGDICTLRFTINPEAPDGAFDKVSATPLVKLSSLEVSSKVVASDVLIRTRITGDIDGDEDVDIDDAVLLFQYSVLPDMYPIDYMGNVDFDKNGSVDIDDAVLLFQYSVLPDLYPIE